MRKALFILGDLSDDDMDWLATAGTKQEFRTDAVLMREGEPVNDVYILLDGRLSVRLKSRGDKEINVMYPGEFIGELSFLDSRPPTATVVAAAPSVVAAISRDKLRDKLDRDASFAAHFYRALGVFLAHRLRRQTMMSSNEAEAVDLLDDGEVADEMDPDLLDSVALAAKRFEWFQSRFSVG